MDDCTSVHSSQQSGGFVAYGVSLWTIAICMTSSWVLLGHCTLIPYQFNGIVIVQRYFIVIAKLLTVCVFGIRIEIGRRGGKDHLFVGELPANTVASHESWRLISPAIPLFLKSLFWLTTHETWKLSIIGPMLGNQRSSVDSPQRTSNSESVLMSSCHDAGI